MSVQALLRQRACTKLLFSVASVSSHRPLLCRRRLYSVQSVADGRPHDATSQAGPSNLGQVQENSPPPTDITSEATSAAPTTETTVGETELKTTKKKGRGKGKKAAPERKPLRNYSEPTRVETYLSSIAAGGQDPTIEDIERHRPAGHAHRESPKYVEEYNALIQTLCHSFTKSQLQDCLRLYGIRTRRGIYHPTKTHFAQAIIEEQWKWPSLEKVQRDIRDRTEVARKQIEVTPSELFIILGHDGANLLQLSSRYKVNVSVKQEPLSLDIEGVRAKVQKFSDEVKVLRKGVVEETFRLPTGAPIPPELRQRVSRLAEAYLENVGDEGLVRICAKNQASLNRAKRFTTRATSEVLGNRPTPMVTHVAEPGPNDVQLPLTEGPATFALYPFTSPRALPWQLGSSPCFRLRKVAQWVYTSAVPTRREHGLAKRSATVQTRDGTELRLRDILLQDALSNENGNVIVKARLGHLLFSAKTSRAPQPLLGPLKGYHLIEKVRQWLTTYDEPTFVPGLPISLVDSSSPQQKIIHRLVYRALASNSVAEDTTSSTPVLPMDAVEQVTLEVVLAQPKESSPSSDEDSSESSPLPMQAQCTRAVESSLNAILPDRAMDIRFVVSKTQNLPESEQPSALRDYATKLHKYVTASASGSTTPDPPLAWMVDGKTYVLHGRYSVRQNVEPVAPGTSATTVVSESIVDLDSKQRSVQSEVICTDPTSDDAWKDFLKGCGTHVSAIYRPPISTLASADEDPAEI